MKMRLQIKKKIVNQISGLFGIIIQGGKIIKFLNVKTQENLNTNQRTQVE